MTKVKICGLTRPLDIEIVNEVLPDYIGFVFAKSRRQISDAVAKELKRKLDPRITTVGVFVNEDPERILWLCNNKVIDIPQLHGDEDEEYITNLKAKLSNPIIKAVRVRNHEDIANAQQLPVDYLLLDAYKEGLYGGSGDTFDWTMISKVQKPYFLAGGLNCDNIMHATNQVKPYAIDISSGVETDGYKDKNKIIDIITKVRSE